MEPKRRLHRGLLTAGAVVAMVLAGLGVAGAQTGDSTTTTAPAGAEAPEESGRKHGRHVFKANLDTAADAIGISREDLLTQLGDGKSIAQVAQSKDVDVQKVIDAMVADAKEHLADAVRSGRLTQAQADERLEKVTEHTTEVVNREGLPERRHGRGHGPDGFGGERIGTDTEPAAA